MTPAAPPSVPAQERSIAPRIGTAMRPAHEVITLHERPLPGPPPRSNRDQAAPFNLHPGNLSGAESRARGIANPYMPARGGWNSYRESLDRLRRNPHWPMPDWSSDSDWHERYQRPPNWSPMQLDDYYCTNCGMCFHSVEHCWQRPTGVTCRKCHGPHPTISCNVTPWVRDLLREEEVRVRDFHRHMQERQTRLRSPTNRVEHRGPRREDGRPGSSSGR